ncbi:hypothetical protein CR513_36960, partial [Mucuna pruriens]
MEIEGHVMDKPPLFKDQNCDYWKQRMDLRGTKNRRQALRASKDLKKLPMEELLGAPKFHEIELNKDERQQKGKFIAHKVQKASKGSVSKPLKVEELCRDTSNEDCFEEDELSFISRKI